MNAPRFSRRREAGYLLLEAMLATAMFALAVLGIARSIEAGLLAGQIQKEDVRARRALVNWMRELEAGAQAYANLPSGLELKGEFYGMKLYQTVVPLELVDQNQQVVEGILEVSLEVVWTAAGERCTKRMKFYANPTAL
jgi:rhamnogalacturonyl hydrolase YesR